MENLIFNHDWDAKLRSEEYKLFFKQWIQHPGRLGTLAPLTVSLARAAASHVKLSNEPIVEIGAG